MIRFAAVAYFTVALSTLAAEPKGTVSRQSFCQRRFEALCAVMQRCSTGAEDLGPHCRAIDSGCDAPTGPASHDILLVEACVAGLGQLACARKADPNDAAAMDFESKVAACRKLAEPGKTATAAR